MEQLLTHITSYLDYLRKEYRLAISVHFKSELLYSLPREALERLLPYNAHQNPYCMTVKRSSHPQCIRHQQALIARGGEAPFCATCHAGVAEYLYPIRKEGHPIGVIAVSGYRGERAPAEPSLWAAMLSDQPIPAKRCEILLPPLALMLEQLFARYGREPLNEYNLILQYLREYHATATLTDLCDRFGRSRSYISHLFKRESGQSLRAYCNDLSLAAATRLLTETDRSVTEIALDLGFNDPSYFILLFRKKYGRSPLQFRKQTNKS